jgi:hypothetical protein
VTDFFQVSHIEVGRVAFELRQRPLDDEPMSGAIGRTTEIVATTILSIQSAGNAPHYATAWSLSCKGLGDEHTSNVPLPCKDSGIGGRWFASRNV